MGGHNGPNQQFYSPSQFVGLTYRAIRDTNQPHLRKVSPESWVMSYRSIGMSPSVCFLPRIYSTASGGHVQLGQSLPKEMIGSNSLTSMCCVSSVCQLEARTERVVNGVPKARTVHVWGPCLLNAKTALHFIRVCLAFWLACWLLRSLLWVYI